jgi:pimeloyl-ACP methyl ester carboxylesterase
VDRQASLAAGSSARDALPVSDGPPIVLVAGACLGGWAWRDVAARLRERGYEVHPVTLTGLGERVHLARPDVDLETHIADVVNLLDDEDLHDAVLVGHSYGGTVVTGIADRRPERLGALVYLDSSPLPDGVAVVDALPPDGRERQQRDVDERGDGWRWPVPDRPTLETGAYGSAAGLTDEHFAAIAERGTPQPYATMTSPLRLTRAEPPPLRRVMVVCTAGGLTADLIRALIEQGDPRAAAMTGLDWELHELDTGHWAMFSAPAATAELIARIAASDAVPRTPG